jgi:hypothetical protein
MNYIWQGKLKIRKKKKTYWINPSEVGNGQDLDWERNKQRSLAQSVHFKLLAFNITEGRRREAITILKLYEFLENKNSI